MVLDETSQALIAAIQDGLPLVSRPYAAIAEQIGISEQEVVRRLGDLIDQGTIKRFGVVVRHHELGYRANAMVVWDIPNERVAQIGERLSGQDCVTLCYQRPRRLPLWPYNLFTMIHGRDRDSVLACIERLIEETGLTRVRHEVLFSKQRFKQRGARYIHAASDQPKARRAHG